MSAQKKARLVMATKSINKLKEFDYNIDWINTYQCRINSTLDIFPISQKFHDLATQHRGAYKNLDKLIENYFN